MQLVIMFYMFANIVLPSVSLRSASVGIPAVTMALA